MQKSMSIKAKLKLERRNWEGTQVKVRPYTGADQAWKEHVTPMIGKVYTVQDVYLSTNGKVVFLSLKDVPGIAFDAYKDVDREENV